MSTTPTVAVIAPGNMGAGVGRRLTENKVTVLTSLAGRSEESVKRAREAGMQPVEERALAEADFFLSIVPPGDALGLATRLVPVLTAANRKPIYVECNAVSPPTMQKIADVIAKTGCPFVGAGIIGPPPKPGSTNTKIYVSGPAAKDVARLNDYGLIVRVLDGAADSRIGAQDVLCRHHQGIYRARHGHDAGRKPRRFGRRAEDRTCRKPS